MEKRGKEEKKKEEGNPNSPVLMNWIWSSLHRSLQRLHVEVHSPKPSLCLCLVGTSKYSGLERRERKRKEK